MPGTFSTDLVTLTDGTATTGWTFDPVNFSVQPRAETAMIVQGTGSLVGSGPATANARVYGIYTITTAINMSATGAAAVCVFAWTGCAAAATSKTKALGGITLGIGSTNATVSGTEPNQSTGGSQLHYVDGSDSNPGGGWSPRVVSPRVTGNFTNGTPSTAAVKYIYYSMFSTVAISNVTFPFWLDALRWGSGHTFTGGTTLAPVTFTDVDTYDNSITNRFSVCFIKQGSVILQGKLRCGSTTQIVATVFKDTNKVILLPDNPVDTDFYEIQVAGTVTLASTFQLGDYTAGVVSGGCTIVGSVGRRIKLSCTDATGAANAYGGFKLYGTSFSPFATTLNANCEIRNCNLLSTGEITPNGAIIANTAISGGAGAGLVFNATTDATNVTGTSLSGNAVGIRITAAGTYTLNGITFSGNTVDIQNSSAGAVVINVTGGSNPVTTSNTGGGTITINQSYPITITVQDSNNTPIAGNGTSTGARVAIYNAAQATITNATWATNVSTYTTAAAHGFVVGQQIVIERVRPLGYNTVVTVASVPTTTSFTVAMVTNPGTYQAGGAAYQVIVAPAYTNASGQVTGTWTSTGVSIVAKVRYSSITGSKYVPQSISGTITASGYANTVTMVQDSIAI